jgi:hypothetical protein
MKTSLNKNQILSKLNNYINHGRLIKIMCGALAFVAKFSLLQTSSKI